LEADLTLLRRLKNLAVPATLVVLCACGSGHVVPITNYDNQPWLYDAHAAPLTADQLSQRIAAAATSQGWRVWPTGPGQMQAEFITRSHHVTVQISYNQATFSIDFVSSVDMNEQGGKIHPKYVQWVEHLRAAILTGAV
jgi:hypothetical protein